MPAPSSLVDVLDLGHRSVVALAGAGGKTTTMWALARELADRGERVACTTTTRIARGQEPPGVRVVSWDDADLRASLDGTLAGSLVPLVLTTDTDDGKSRGISPEQADSLASMVEHLIVEADGARRLPLKVPRSHEPALPSSTSHLVVIVGVAAMGRTATTDVVFHLEELVERGILASGGELDPRTIRSLLVSRHGYLPCMQGPVRGFFAANGPDLDRAAVLARELWHPDIEAALATDSRSGVGLRVDNAHHRISAVVLAAGMSVRFGANKMLHQVNGRPMVHHPVQAALDSGVEDVLVVLGHEADAVRAALGYLAEDARVRTVVNPRFPQGLGTSLSAGVRACESRADAVMVLLGDMPGVDASLLTAVMHAYRSGAAQIAAPVLDGRTGHPAILGAPLYPRLVDLRGDQGAREVIRAHADRTVLLELDGDASQRDMDSPH